MVKSVSTLFLSHSCMHGLRVCGGVIVSCSVMLNVNKSIAQKMQWAPKEILVGTDHAHTHTHTHMHTCARKHTHSTVY